MLTVACVLKKSEIYTQEWVYKLRRSVEKNLSIPFRFLCLSDTAVDCEYIPLIHNTNGWWNKIELFRPNILTEETLYFDLDVVVSKPLDLLVENLRKAHDNFFMAKEEPFKNPNSSVMYWKGDFSNLYHKYYSDPLYYNKVYRKGLLLGDQGFISESIKHNYINNFIPENYISWCKDRAIKVDNNTGMLIFLSSKCKPHMFQDNVFIKEFWS